MSPHISHTPENIEGILKEYGWDTFKSPLHTFKNNDDLPFITLGILHHNRREALKITLNVLKEIQYPDFEIIVVDNASTDGTAEMMKNEFPSVQFIRLLKNTGTAGRNEFLKRARGKYIFCYDDDTVPASPDTVVKMVEFMEENPEIAALCGNYFQPLTGIEETAGWEKFAQKKSVKGSEGIFLVEGGVCFRNSVLKETGYYDEENLWGAEGSDLSFEFLKKGHLIHLNRDFTTLHFKFYAGRPPNRDTNWKTQNMIRLLAKHFPVWAFIPLSFGYVVRRIVGIAIRPKTAIGVLKGIVKGFSGAGKFLKRMPKLTLKQMLFLKRWYLMLYRW
ncbi:MAG: glycosyltransferase [Bacteroidota bacterium]